MPSPNATPTPITPPRVPLVDPRTGLIDRAWYLFFLSLNNIATTVVDDGGLGPSVESLIASYDAALQALAQEVETQPPPVDLSAELIKQIEAAGLEDCCSGLLSQVAEMQKQLEALNLLPPPSQGTVTAVTATTPVVSSGGTVPDISMPAASTSVSGYLTSTDWNTFNGKAPATSGTSILYGNGSGGFSNVTIGTGVSFAAGTLSATGSGGTVTSVTGTAPVVSSGGTTPAISMAAANTSTNGYLTSTDWNTFNGKGSGTVTSVAALTLGTTGTDLTSTVANGTTTPVITLNVPTASASNRGALSAADWTTFNNKGSGTVTSVSFTGGIITVANPTTTPAFTVAGTSGGVPYFSSASTWATSAALTANALVVGGGAGAAPSTITTGTGVVTALGVNTGTAGAFVVNGGALGTPSSGTVTNLTGTASININGTVGATSPAAGSFTSVTNSGLTSGRVVYTTTGGLETSSANLLYSGTDLTVYGLTVGRGNGALATNTAIGATALSGANTGSGLNTAVGYNTMSGNTSGQENVGLGVSALASNSTGNYNVALGRSALSTATGSNNTAIGYQAGSGISSGAKNVLIGGYTGTGAPISATGSNYIVLSDGDGTVRGSWDSNGNFLTKSAASAGSYNMFKAENGAATANFNIRDDGRLSTGGASAPYNIAVGATNKALYVDNNGIIGYLSSVRASKRNIESYLDNSWIYQLDPVEFEYKARDDQNNYLDKSDGDRQYGLIAEDVASVNERICFYKETDDSKILVGVDYNKLIVPLLKAIQELNTTVQAQTETISLLTTRISALEAK